MSQILVILDYINDLMKMNFLSSLLLRIPSKSSGLFPGRSLIFVFTNVVLQFIWAEFEY